MSDKDMPSRQALDLAVKPAMYDSWDEFRFNSDTTGAAYDIALAYAADLDKADKVGRMILEVTPEKLPAGPARDCRELARELILPDPIDPDLLEAREMAAKACEAHGNLETAIAFRGGRHDEYNGVTLRLEGLRRGRELAKEQDRG